MKPRGIVLLPLLIIIVALAAVGTVGYFIWQANQSNSNGNTNSVVVQNTNVNSNTNQTANANYAVNTNSAAPIDTTNWKTYSSTIYLFSFRYPSDWQLTEGENNNPYNIQVFSAGDGFDGNSGSITIWPDSARAPQTEITYTKSTVTYGGRTATQSETTNKATGKPAYRGVVFTSTPSGWGPQHGIYVYPAKADGSYAIQSKILETLQFTDPTAGWNTYTNTTYGYSIRYPSEYSPSEIGAVYQFVKGQPSTAGYSFLGIRVVTQQNASTAEDADLYTWAQQGFPANAAVGKYHQNPRQEVIGNLTFVAADGDLASTGMPEYFLFHNDRVYYFHSYASRGSQSQNKELLATFQFTD